MAPPLLSKLRLCASGGPARRRQFPVGGGSLKYLLHHARIMASRARPGRHRAGRPGTQTKKLEKLVIVKPAGPASVGGGTPRGGRCETRTLHSSVSHCAHLAAARSEDKKYCKALKDSEGKRGQMTFPPGIPATISLRPRREP